MLGVRSFDAFAAEHRQFKTGGLSVLRGKVLGIDANWFVFKTLSADNNREPLIYAVGGFPTSLQSHIESLLESLCQNSIKPLFVISGTALAPLERPFERPDIAVRQRNHAWSLYEDGQGEQAVKIFDEAEPFPLKHGIRTFVNLLIKNEVDFMVAPHSAASQLAYLNQEQFVDAVYSSSDYFLYENCSDRLITSMDVKNESFQWVSKKNFLGDLRMSHAMFVEAAISVGCGLNSRTFPQIEHMMAAQNTSNALAIAQEILQANGSIFAAVASFPEPDYLDRFQKAVAAATLEAVQKANGHVGQLDPSAVPSDVHLVVGQRLPDEFYFYMSRGLVGPDFLTGFSNNMLAERAPLDGGDVTQYRQFILGLQDLKDKINSFFVQNLHRYFQFNPINTIFWFQPSTDHKFTRINPPLYVTIGTKWRLVDNDLSGIDVNIAGLLGALANSDFVSKSNVHKTPSPVLKSDNEIIGSALCRALEAAGFVDSTHNLTGWGRALQQGIAKAPQFAESLVVATALIKAGVLTADPYTPSYGSSSAEPDAKWSRLISRVALHISLHHKPVGYVGPLSRALLCYQSFAAAQTTTYRWLVESTLVSLLANGDADRLSRETDKAWQTLVPRIPFADSPSAATGIAMQSYLEEVVSCGSSSTALETLKSMFSAASDLSQDLSAAFSLWDAVVVVAKEANASNLISKELYDQFASADAWAKPKRL